MTHIIKIADTRYDLTIKKINAESYSIDIVSHDTDEKWSGRFAEDRFPQQLLTSSLINEHGMKITAIIDDNKNLILKPLHPFIKDIPQWILESAPPEYHNVAELLKRIKELEYIAMPRFYNLTNDSMGPLVKKSVVYAKQRNYWIESSLKDIKKTIYPALLHDDAKKYGYDVTIISSQLKPNVVDGEILIDKAKYPESFKNNSSLWLVLKPHANIGTITLNTHNRDMLRVDVEITQHIYVDIERMMTIKTFQEYHDLMFLCNLPFRIRDCHIIMNAARSFDIKRPGHNPSMYTYILTIKDNKLYIYCEGLDGDKFTIPKHGVWYSDSTDSYSCTHTSNSSIAPDGGSKLPWGEKSLCPYIESKGSMKCLGYPRCDVSIHRNYFDLNNFSFYINRKDLIL